MPTYLTTIETDNEIILQWYGKEVGDSVSNPNGFGVEHLTIMTSGIGLVEIEGQAPFVITAPQAIMLPVNTSYTISAVGQGGAVHCIYNKNDPGIAEIAHLLDMGTIIFS
jgi:hypothetical protein